MIGKLHVIAIASILSLSAFAANAAESRPKSISCNGPDYPKAWVDDDLQGTVHLSVLVGADGAVKEARLIESSGYRSLDKASLRASATCKFEVSSSGGDTAPGWSDLRFKWVTE